MLKYIEELQKKPEHVRRRTLYIVVSVLMFVIIFIWISTISIRFSDNEKDTIMNTSDLSPSSVLKDRVNIFYDNFVGNIDSIIGQFSE